MLVVVESPNKVKKIQGFLNLEYEVISTVGHIRDYSRRYGGKLPEVWENIKDKHRVINDLKKAYKRHKQNIIIATDPDREGEAIAWHICEILEIPVEKALRCRFSEITKDAVCNAIERAEKGIDKIDVELINAQRTRRLLDRRLGYSATRFLWKSIGGGVSAGRCLVPAATLLDQHSAKYLTSGDKYVIRGKINTNIGSAFLYKEITPEDTKYDHDTIGNNETYLKSFVGIPNKTSPGITGTIIVKNINKTKIQRNAPKPLSTSDILSKVGGSPVNTMAKLQKLFETGYITYHRTDSNVLSKDFVSSVVSCDTNAVYKPIGQTVVGTSEGTSSNHAHEAIRPTNWETISVPDDSLIRIYNMIREHAIGSLFPTWHGEQVSVVCENGWKFTFQRTLDKDEGGSSAGGWLGAVYKAPPTIYSPGISELKIGDKLEIEDGYINVRKEHGGKSITESSMVKILENAGIGRPSTYSTIVSHLIKRGYVSLVPNTNKTLCSYDIHSNTFITNFKDTCNNYDSNDEDNSQHQNQIEKHHLELSSVGKKCLFTLNKSPYNPLFDIYFTSEMEKSLDKIAQGLIEWTDYVKGFEKQISSIEYYNTQELKIKAEEYTKSMENKREVSLDAKIPFSKLNGPTNVSVATTSTEVMKKTGAFPDTVLGETDGYRYGKGRTRYGTVLWREKTGDAVTNGKYIKREYRKITAKQWYMIKLGYALKAFK